MENCTCILVTSSYIKKKPFTFTGTELLCLCWKAINTIWMLTFCSLNPFKTIQRGTLLLQALFCLSVNYFFHKNLCRHQIFMGPVIPRQSPVLERVMYIHPKETLDKFMVIYWYSFSFVLILILLEALL